MSYFQSAKVEAATCSPGASRTYKVLALSLGSVLSMLGGIAFAMVAARFLSKHDYATVRQTFLAYEFVAPLLLLGLPNALYYLLPRTETGKRGILVDNIALLTILGLIFSFFLLLGGHVMLAERFDNPDLQQTLSWLMVYPLLMMPIAGMAAPMVIAGRVTALAVYNAVSSLAVTSVSIGAVLLTQSYEIPILVRILVPGLALPIGLYLMFRSVPGSLRLPCVSSMLEMARFALPLGLATMLGTITMQLHALIVAALCTPEDFAVYINGAIEIPLIGIVTGSITAVIFAEMSTLCAAGNKPKAVDIFRKAAEKSACLLIPTMFYFAVAAESFILFLYSEEYKDSIQPFLIYLAIIPARIVVYGAAMMALGMTREILFRSMIDLLVNAAFCYLFVRAFGYLGAAIGLVATLYFWTIPYNLHKIAEGFGVHWTHLLPWKELMAISAIGLVSTVPALLVIHGLQDFIQAMQLLFSGIAYVLVCGYLLYCARLITLPQKLIQRLPEVLQRSCNLGSFLCRKN